MNSPNVELARARERANATQKHYETVKRLSEKGSVSQRGLRRSDMQRKVALLDYSSLLNPNRREKNLRLKSEVILQFRSEELAVMKKLYWRGSISEVDYLRSVAARDIAAFNFKATQSGDQTQRKIQAIKAAKSRYDVAQKEFEIASQLFSVPCDKPIDIGPGYQQSKDRFGGTASEQAVSRRSGRAGETVVDRK